MAKSSEISTQKEELTTKLNNLQEQLDNTLETSLYKIEQHVGKVDNTLEMRLNKLEKRIEKMEENITYIVKCERARTKREEEEAIRKEEARCKEIGDIHEAVETEDSNAVKWFLKNGSVDTADYLSTALEYSRYNTDVLKILLDHSPKGILNKDYNYAQYDRPLWMRVGKNTSNIKKDIIQLLREYGANIPKDPAAILNLMQDDVFPKAKKKKKKLY